LIPQDCKTTHIMKKKSINKLALDKSVISNLQTKSIKGGVGTLTTTTMLTITIPNGTGTSTATIQATSATLNDQ